MADELIHFQAPSGLVLGMTLPLHESIEHQWRTGELQRVNEDGSPWQGDNDALPGEPDEALEYDEAPARPKGNAHLSKWQAYAVVIGAATEDEAADMTRDQLRDLCTPPEEKPEGPEG